MKDVIQKIINIENEAQFVMDSAEQEKIDRRNELEESLKKLKESLLEDANRKISVIREKEIAEVKIIAAGKETECLYKLETIQKHFEENKEQWAESLVNAVLKR